MSAPTEIDLEREILSVLRAREYRIRGIFSTYEVRLALGHRLGDLPDEQEVGQSLRSLRDDLVIYRPDHLDEGWWAVYSPESVDSLMKLARRSSDGELSRTMENALRYMLDRGKTQWPQGVWHTNTRDALVRRGLIARRYTSDSDPRRGGYYLTDPFNWLLGVDEDSVPLYAQMPTTADGENEETDIIPGRSMVRSVGSFLGIVAGRERKCGLWEVHGMSEFAIDLDDSARSVLDSVDESDRHFIDTRDLVLVGNLIRERYVPEQTGE